MSTIKELLELGESMVLTGTELRDFIRDEQTKEREERQRERDERQIESERAHQLRLMRETAEATEKELVAQSQIEKEREVREIREHERKMELLSIQPKLESHSGNDSTLSTFKPCRSLKIPPFEEGKDDMDAYLQRFERYATAQKWNNEQWAPNLSVLLKGHALEVYSRLTPEQAMDYEILKCSLLQRFDMTVEGFRKKFRSGRPDAGETFKQFAKRLDNYLVRWLELGKSPKTYEGLKDMVIRDQFVQTCNNELRLFIQERTPGTIEEMAKLADQYSEARGNPTNLVKPKYTHKRPDDRNPRQGSAEMLQWTGRRTEDVLRRPTTQKQCYICNRSGHLSFNCPKKEGRGRVGAVTEESALEDRKSYSLRRAKRRNGRQNNSHERESKGCSYLDSSEEEEENVGLSYMSVSSSSPTKAKLPVLTGFVGKHKVNVLRDTGCSGVVIKEALVEDEQFTGDHKTCVLADGSKVRVPTAKVDVRTPYFEGNVVAWCMKSPVYDLILGNIEGVRPPDKPYPESKEKEEEEEEERVGAVETRAQKEKKEKPHRPLKVVDGIDNVSPEDIKREQQNDDSLAKIRDLSKSKEVKMRQDGGMSRFFSQRGLIKREFQSPAVFNGRLFKQLIVPSKYRDMVLRIAHDNIMSGHLGVKRTLDRVTSEFYWPGMAADVTRYCRSCDICQRTFPKGRVAKAPLGSMPLIDTPFQRIAVDIIGPLHPPTERGNRFILTIMDYATLYPEAVALKGIQTEQVAEALVDVYSRVGIPREILTDQGTQFTSDLMKEVSRLLSMRQLVTTPYHPMCNGLIERFNGTLKQMLKRMCSERPKDWDKYLSAVLFAYREVPQESLGFSPFDLLYGRMVRGPMMILKELWTNESPDPDTKTTYQYVVDLKQKLEETCKLAHEQLKSAKKKQHQYYNRKAKPKGLKVGDKVLVLLPTKRNKLLMQWRGPYDIEERKGSVDYKVKVNGKSKTLHANLLRQYVERERVGAVNAESTILSGVGCAIIEESDETVCDNMGTDGISTNPSPIQTETIDDVHVSEHLSGKQKRDAPRPDTKKQVRSFIGLASFYRKFIPHFASISAPLTDLTRKGQPNKIIWWKAHESAFVTLKKLLSSSPILRLPDLESEFLLRTDASDIGLGAVLLQAENDIKYPIAYASRKLKDSERAYAVVEKEGLAVVWAIQKFEKYLYGKEFTLETDHQPLLYINKQKGTNARLMRWALLLQPYRFKIKAIRGSENIGADFLSRVC